MTNVYVVAKGEYGEGHDPERVFSNLAGARDWCNYQWGVRPEATGVGTWMTLLDGCDEIWIHRMKVWDR